MMVQATLVAPSSLVGKFSKSNLRRKDVYLQGVNWETADHLCNKCNVLVYGGYGNYVTNLKKENDELKKRLEFYENSIDSV